MARLPKGVRRRKNGTLEKRFSVNGKPYSIYASNVKELETKEIEIRKKIDSGIYNSNRNIICDKYFAEWIARKRNHVKSSTLRTYKCNYINHISPAIGQRRLQQIEKRELIDLQMKIANNVSANASNYCMKIVKMILQDACGDDILSKNPAAGIKALKEKKEKAVNTIHRALTEQEQKDFMDELETDYYYEFIAFLLCSGMRTGEAAALTWKDIDYKNQVIHITKTITFGENGNLIVGDSAKTDTSNRDIPLTETLKGILNRWKRKSITLKMDGEIFNALEGGYIYSHAVNRAIDDVLSRLEEKGIVIERFTAHCLRDTYATRYLENDGKLQTLKTILGHRSLAMTADLYAHVLPNTKAAEAEQVKFDIVL